MMETVLELQHVNKSFGDFTLKDVSFSLEKGYIMGFIGANGAGKSTTIRCILDLIHADSGEFKLFGENTRGHLADLKQRIGFVFDQDVFFGELTAERNRRVIAPFYREWDNAAFYKYIRQFDVPLNKKIKNLSKGTKMKFALAVALSHHAELIIMDEPTSGLDPIFRKELLDILLEVIQDENKAIFFSTHITTDLEKVADYITFIRDGEIVLSEETEQLLDHYVLIKGPKNLEDEVRKINPIVLSEKALGFEAFAEAREVKQIASATNVHLQRPSLDEIMYYLVKSHKIER